MTESALADPGAATAEGPVAMLNVLWFRRDADDPDAGKKAYARYAAAAAPHLEQAGAKLTATLRPEALVLGQGDPTDDLASADVLFVIQWPSWKIFLETVQSPDYQKIALLREQALERSLLIRCAPTGAVFG